MSKHILIPSYDFKPALGGVAHYVHELASQWVELGYEVTILARAQEGDHAFDLEQKYKVIRINTAQTAILTLPTFAKNIRKLCTELEPDFIFCPLWFPDGAATFLSRAYKKIPYYVAAHGSELFLTNDSLKHTVRSLALRILQKSVLSTATKLFSGSQYTKGIMQSLPGADPARVIATSCGVNTKIFHRRENPFPFAPELKDKKILLTVTRLCDYKGVDYMLRSLPTVISKIPDVHYVVVGVGPDADRLKEITQQLNLNSYVTFTGRISYDKIIDLYSHATLFVMLSREKLPDVEGFGLVFLEAAACGLPSLAGNSGGIPDAVEDQRSGWLVDPTSVTDVSDKLVHILSSPAELKAASEYCLESAPKRTWLKPARIILEAIDGN